MKSGECAFWDSQIIQIITFDGFVLFSNAKEDLDKNEDFALKGDVLIHKPLEIADEIIVSQLI